MRTIRELRIFLGVEAGDKWGPVAQAALDAIIKTTPSDEPEKVDARSEKAIATLHSRVQPLARSLVNSAKDKGIKIVLTSATRTYEQQNELYAQGRTKPGKIVTNAKGGYSNHNFGLAFDVTVFKGSTPVWDSPAYKTVGALGRALGLEWGGDWKTFKDEPHFQLRPSWATGKESEMLAELRRRKAAGKDAFA